MHALTISSEFFCGRVLISQTSTQWDREEGILGDLADSGIRKDFISSVKFTWARYKGVQHNRYINRCALFCDGSIGLIGIKYLQTIHMSR
ncbi:hypothetical protein CEXT_113801 [Caerostris extrusa]|uniref:Uncharacterized protein n=1 Tax=Caerostris extrusa TaxID=172846 RepID=A0AAV4PK75_CAEEX|nr:hypothetical protein CEXT_113801 [Caerostris extrusa]